MIEAGAEIVNSRVRGPAIIGARHPHRRTATSGPFTLDRRRLRDRRLRARALGRARAAAASSACPGSPTRSSAATSRSIRSDRRPRAAAADARRPLDRRARTDREAAGRSVATITDVRRHRRRLRRRARTSTATSAASSSRPTGASGSPQGREMIQGNRGDRQRRLPSSACTTTCTRPTTGTCRSGGARVVLHDLRDGSPTDGATLTLDLGAQPGRRRHDHRGVYIPPGVAHGFAALTDMTITYLVDGYYNPADELGVAWDDPEIGADWGVTDPIAVGPRPGEPRARADLPADRRALRRAADRLTRRGDPTRMKLFVTGGAGFIGSNYVRYVLANTDDEVTVYDALTYAGNLVDPARRRRRPALRVREGQHLRPGHARGRDGRPRRRGALRGREPRRPLDRRPRRLRPHQLLRHQRRDATRPAGSRSTGCCTSAPTRSTARSRRARRRRPTRSSPARRTRRRRPGSDLIALSYHHTYGLPVVVTRCTNNFGPYQFPEKVIPLFVTNLLDGRPVPLYGDGLNVRDWLYVDDHCAGVDLVLAQGEVGEIYNIGAGNETPNRVLVDKLLALFGVGEEMVEYVEDRLGHDRRYSVDIAKVTALGWRTSRARSTRRWRRPSTWYRDNRWWWEPLKDAAPAAEPVRGDAMRVLITGAGGQVGRELVTARSIGRGQTRSSAPTRADARRRRRRRGAAGDRRRVATRRGLILHAGACTAVDALRDRARARRYRSTRSATRHVADAARRVGAHVVLRVDRLRVRRHQARALRRVGRDRTRSRSTAARSWAASTELGPRVRRIVRTSWVCGDARRQHGQDGAAPGRPSPSRCASSTTSAATRPSPPTWPSPIRRLGRRAAAGPVPRHQPGRGELVRVRAGRSSTAAGPRPRPGAARSPPPSSTRPGPRPARRTRCSTTPRCAWPASPCSRTTARASTLVDRLTG